MQNIKLFFHDAVLKYALVATKDIPVISAIIVDLYESTRFLCAF